MEMTREGQGFLLLRPTSSHEGVAGIVAGKVREATGKPCAVLTESQDDKELLKGSARSVGRLDVTALLRGHGDLFERLGGHAAAAGFTINEKNLEPLRKALAEDMTKLLEKDPDLLIEKNAAELEIEVSDVTFELIEAIESLSPFGSGNPRPLLSFCVGADKISGIRTMGQDGKHLRFFADGIQCVFFGGADTVFPDEGEVRLSGCPEINEWNGNRNIQFAVAHVDMLQ